MSNNITRPLETPVSLLSLPTIFIDNTFLTFLWKITYLKLNVYTSTYFSKINMIYCQFFIKDKVLGFF
jgi:hypothetical protein